MHVFLGLVDLNLNIFVFLVFINKLLYTNHHPSIEHQSLHPLHPQLHLQLMHPSLQRQNHLQRVQLRLLHLYYHLIHTLSLTPGCIYFPLYLQLE